jgi:hypothetical protein
MVQAAFRPVVVDWRAAVVASVAVAAEAAGTSCSMA